VGASPGWWKIPSVLVEETSERFIATLAEKIGFADGLVGQGAVKCGGGRGQQYGSAEDGNVGSEKRGH
jgi:hypothetical protein